MGQVMAIQSGGLLRATPHCVRAAAAGEPGVSRNTFAVFMQPETSMPLQAPQAAAALGALLCMDSGHWTPGMRCGCELTCRTRLDLQHKYAMLLSNRSSIFQL
jgi:isopenicillin N synthase-like dioxygenase